jgi:parallel beta-helix repeat protein
MKKSASAVCSLLLLLAPIVLFSGFDSVVASSGAIPESNPDLALPVIYIRSDGSVEGTNLIERNGDTYTFKGDIGSVDWDDYYAFRENNMYSQGIVVERDNIVIDGAGYALTGCGHFNIYYFGPDGKGGLQRPSILNQPINGMNIVGISNVTIKNLKVQLFWTSIRISKCTDITLLSNNLTGYSCGVEIGNSSQVTIISNELRGSVDSGVSISNSSHCLTYNNSFVGNTYGLGLSSLYDGITEYLSMDNVIANNQFTDNGYAMQVGGGQNNIIANNNITNSGEGGIVMFGTANVIHDNYISSNKAAVEMWAGIDNIFYENHIINNTAGVAINECVNNTFYSNNFIDNTEEVISQYGYWKVEENYTSSINFWDNGRVGNYWSSYNGSDKNWDGIGDTPYPFYPVYEQRVTVYCGQDNYPLMSPVEVSSGIADLPDWAYEKLRSLSIPLPEPTQPEPFPTALAVGASGASIAIIGVGLLVYFKKRKH